MGRASVYTYYDEFYGALYSNAPLFNVTCDTVDIYKYKASDFTVKYYDSSKKSDDLYYWDNLKFKDKYTVFFNGNNSLISIKSNNNNSNRNLLVYKYSFAHALVPFLATHYENIYMVGIN